jgi:hypothetical protein
MRNALKVILVLALLSGCATASKKSEQVYDLLRKGETTQAIELLKVPAELADDDQLVYLLELGTALQVAGQYEESNKIFERANRLADIQDYHSLSRITGALLISERLIQYKGDDFEKVLINAMMAINYAALGDLDGALVEARRLNQKLYKFKFEAKRDYEQNPFARYLSAVLYEADKNWDSAYIDYEEAYKLQPSFEDLRPRLVWAAKKASRGEAHAKWKKTFGNPEVPASWSDPTQGELVVIYQQGAGPVKAPHPDWPRIPKLYPRYTVGKWAAVRVESQEAVRSQIVFDSEAVSIKTLDDTYAGLIAKRVAGIAAKAVVADQIRQKNELLGQLAWIGMNLADQADLRQWNTLPQTFQMARIPLKPGKYKVEVAGLDISGNATGESSGPREIEIKSGKKVFLPWRSFR